LKEEVWWTVCCEIGKLKYSVWKEQEVLWQCKEPVIVPVYKKGAVTDCSHLYQLQTEFKVCKSVHHYTIQVNQPTRCNNFSSSLPDVSVQISMFRASSRPPSGAQQLQ
jgi:hypothetical protein